MTARTPIAPLRTEPTAPVKLPRLLETPARLPRRQFLAAAAAAPALAVCALLSRPHETAVTAPPATSGETPDETPGDDVGYHETEHVRRYYRSAAGF